MAKPSMPDPVAAAQRVKDLARDLASDVTDTYRRSNKFLRMRAAIVGSWVLLSLVSLYAACPSSGPANELAAEAMILPETLVGQQLSVSNGSREMWTDVTLTLDGRWEHRIPTVRAGQNVVVGVAKFAKNGAAPPQDFKPRKLEVECDQGSAVISLQAR